MPFPYPEHTHVPPDDGPALPPPDQRVGIPDDLLFPVDVAESYPLSGRVVWLTLATAGTWLTRTEITSATGMAQSSVLNATNELCEGGHAQWRYDTWVQTQFLFRVADPQYHVGVDADDSNAKEPDEEPTYAGRW